MAQINLRPLLESIRTELEGIDRQRESASRPALFELQSLDLELKFVASTEEKCSGGIDLRIVSLGDDESIRSEAVQTIRLSYRVAPKSRTPGSRFHSTSDQKEVSQGFEMIE